MIEFAMPDKLVTSKFLEKINSVIKQAIFKSISEFTKQGIEKMQELENKMTNSDRTATKQVKNIFPISLLSSHTPSDSLMSMAGSPAWTGSSPAR